MMKIEKYPAIEGAPARSRVPRRARPMCVQRTRHLVDLRTMIGNGCARCRWGRTGATSRGAPPASGHPRAGRRPYWRDVKV